MPPLRLAIIGGTGVYDPGGLTGAASQTVVTPYGLAQLLVGSYQGQEVAFVARHGTGHSVPPHRVNYRANVWALRQLGVERVVATAAVGSLDPAAPPGSLVLPDQFLDFTWGRPSTFFDGESGVVRHQDVTNPYCPELRTILGQQARVAGWSCRTGGTLVCTQGPRFETAAEIHAFRLLGGTVVGMTGVPEAVLARELGLCYATAAIVTNFAAGVSADALSHEEVVAAMASWAPRLKDVLLAALVLAPASRGCRCGG